jgi:hypothetical protein
LEGRDLEPRFADLLLAASTAASVFSASMLTWGEPRLMPAQYRSSNIQFGNSRARSDRSSV